MLNQNHYFTFSVQDIAEMAVNSSRANQLRVLLLRTSQDLRSEDLSRMRFLLVDLAEARADMGANELFTELEVRGYVRTDDLSFVGGLLRAIGRSDLGQKLDQYSPEGTTKEG